MSRRKDQKKQNKFKYPSLQAPNRQKSSDKLTFTQQIPVEQEQAENEKRQAARKKAMREKTHPRLSKLATKKPAKKLKLTHKGYIVVIFLIGALVLGLYVMVSRPSAIDKLSLTYLDSLNKDSLGYTIPSSYDNAYDIEDYTIYGESLVLYHNKYEEGENTDALYGRNVTLKNIETGQELTYTFSGGADSGIPLGELDPGVYEIYVYDGYTRKRAYSETPFEAEPLITMRRNKEITSVNLDASSRYLRKTGVTSDKNYLYLTVTSSLPKVKVVDVMIDPSGLELYQNSATYEPGYKSDLIDEAAAGYTFAEEIKSALNVYGLRAEVTRTSNEANSYYGQDSRVGVGYAKQAKVFLALSLTDDEDQTRPYIVSSPYTNGGLANSIAHALDTIGVQLYDIQGVSTITDPGTTLDAMQWSATGLSVFSVSAQLRETGGKATYTGAQESSSANSDFQNKYGMYGILFNYASSENTESQEYFLTNEGDMADGIAQGIASYFNIPTSAKEESN